MSSRNIIGLTGSIAFGKIAAMLAGFIVPLFLTRFLSKNDYGVFSQFNTIVLFLGQILSFGVQSSLYYFFPTASNKQKTSIIGNTFLMIIIFSLIGTLLINVPLLGEKILGDESLWKNIDLVSICIFSISISKVLEPLFVVRKDKFGAAFIPVTEIILRMIIIVIIALVFGTLRSIFTGITFFYLTFFIFVLIYSFYGTNLINNYKNIIDVELLKKQIAYALPFGFTIIIANLLRQFDKLVCISKLTTADYAIYSVAFFGIPGIRQIYESISQVNLVNMTKEYQIGNIAKVLLLYKSFITKTSSFSFPVILISFLFANVFIPVLFTDKYTGSVPFFRMYIICLIFEMLGAGIILRAINQTKTSFRAFAFSAIICIPMTFLLINHFGMWGAMTSAMISNILPRLIQIFYEIKLLGTSVKRYIPWNGFGKIALISLILIIPFVVIHFAVNLNIYWVGCLSIIYIIITYLLLIKNNLFIYNKSNLLSILQRARNILIKK